MWLVDKFEERCADRTLGVVVLRSPTGLGKTEVVSEFYEELADHQPQGRFWPARLAIQVGREQDNASFTAAATRRIDQRAKSAREQKDCVSISGPTGFRITTWPSGMSAP